MRHLAWLHATPEGSKKSRLRSFSELDENSSFLKLPNIEGAEYLVSLLTELGFVSQSGMSVTSVTWLEMDAWMRRTQLELSLWETLTLKEMSEVYANELVQASAKDRPAPYVYVDPELQSNRDAVAEKLKSIFSSFKRNAKT